MSHWMADQLGFPYIFVEGMGFWMHFYPVSKLQYEIYLLQQGKNNADYEPMLALNPRVSLRKATRDNYENLFVSGVLIEEAKGFSEWLDAGSDNIPTVEEWQQAYRWAACMPPLPLPECSEGWNISAQRIWQKLESILKPKNMAQQMLMENGLLEWGQRFGLGRPVFGGMGKPRKTFAAYLRKPDSDPVIPINSSNRTNLKDYGFRLMRKTL